MSLPLSFFYYIYLIFVAVFLFYTFSNVYHLIRFGGKTLSVLVVSSFYIVVSIVMLGIAWRYIGQINWQQSLEIIPAFKL